MIMSQFFSCFLTFLSDFILKINRVHLNIPTFFNWTTTVRGIEIFSPIITTGHGDTMQM